METIALHIRLPEGMHDVLIAELADAGFEAFEQNSDELTAYGPDVVWNGNVERSLKAWLRTYDPDVRFEVQVLPQENWNERWEAGIQPLEVGGFVIAPTWAAPGFGSADTKLLFIDPKMSFGTGHHESTRIALRLLEKAVRPGNSVLDAGTGTGILALAALKTGCAYALGFDLDPVAVANAKENAALNKAEATFEVREGTIDAVQEKDFDVVVANMIRSRLAPLIPRVAEKLAPHGSLVFSGLLQEEKALIEEHFERAGLRIAEEANENEWWGGICRKM